MGEGEGWEVGAVAEDDGEGFGLLEGVQGLEGAFLSEGKGLQAVGIAHGEGGVEDEGGSGLALEGRGVWGILIQPGVGEGGGEGEEEEGTQQIDEPLAQSPEGGRVLEAFEEEGHRAEGQGPGFRAEEEVYQQGEGSGREAQQHPRLGEEEAHSRLWFSPSLIFRVFTRVVFEQGGLKTFLLPSGRGFKSTSFRGWLGEKYFLLPSRAGVLVLGLRPGRFPLRGSSRFRLPASHFFV